MYKRQDLDTVMPGLVGHDFGDAIRFAANYVEEDSPEAEKAGVDMEVFRAFTQGFLKHTAATLTQQEVDTLALSCFALTCELATRFLDDYILGLSLIHISWASSAPVTCPMTAGCALCGSCSWCGLW